MRKIFYLSAGIERGENGKITAAYPPILSRWFEQLNRAGADASFLVFHEDVFGWRADPQMACDGIIIVHLWPQRVRYNFLSVPRNGTRELGMVPVLFVTLSGINNSGTIVGVNPGLFIFAPADDAEYLEEAMGHLLDFCQ